MVIYPVNNPAKKLYLRVGLLSKAKGIQFSSSYCRPSATLQVSVHESNLTFFGSVRGKVKCTVADLDEAALDFVMMSIRVASSILLPVSLL